MRSLMSKYKLQAKKRGLLWSITEKQFHKLTKSNCHYCDKKPNQNVYARNPEHKYIYNGLDRKNTLKGYTKYNCVPCCKRCNAIKGHLVNYKQMLIIGGLLKFLENPQVFKLGGV